MSFKPQTELYRQLSFISYYFHWSLDTVLNLPHLERVKFCGEISNINQEANGKENNIFDM